ncbi:hypothetical protein L1280_002781 [Deinococcus sp. HSC-46F16]|uniref:hypothetical protein n=1 Tax=Deinococcus sp. HSC-46F16 TaxID=2910968 RepID=UPI00209F45C7|nr:hypothetical protein [Deinococcus sp. HSC-46F16]MCP2015613.1 hypothetical protein [Deinococcus sp. HSC-46F16]
MSLAEQIKLQIVSVVSGQQQVTALTAQVDRLTQSTERLDGVYRDVNGRLRNAQGQFVAAGGAAGGMAGGFGAAAAGAGRLNLGLLNLNAGIQIVQQVAGAVQGLVNQMGEYARQADAVTVSQRSWDTVLERFNVDAGEAQGVIDDLVDRTGASEMALKGAAAQYIKMGGTLEDFQKGALAAASSWSDLTVKSITLDESISNVTLGLAMGRSEMMESSGIVVNASQAWEKYADSVGKSVDDLSDAEKAHAYALAVYKEEQIGIETLADKQTDLTRATTENTRAREEMGRTIGAVVLPAYTQMVRGGTDLYRTVTELTRAYQQGGAATDELARKNPALTAALERLKPAADQMRAGLLSAWEGIQGAYQRVLVPIFERIRPLAEQAFTYVPGIVESAGKLIGETFQLISDLWENVLHPVWDAIAPVVSAAFAGVAAALDGALKFVTGIFSAIRALIAGDWKGAWEAAKDAVGTALLGLETLLSGVLTNLNSVIDRAARSLADKAKTMGEGLRDGMISGLANLSVRLATTISEAVENATRNLPDWAKRILGIGNLQGYLEGVIEAAGGAGEDASDRTDARTQADVANNGRDLPPNSFAASVFREALEQRGLRTADEIVNYCAQWVRDTLGDAAPGMRSQIDKLFQSNPGKNGPNAVSAYQNFRAAGLTRQYTSLADLKPGDTVFYADGGQNHVGVYVGDGLVRGNNRVTFQQNGGKLDAKGNPVPGSTANPVGNVGINQLGHVTAIVRADDLVAYITGRAPVTDTPKAGTPTNTRPTGGTTPPPAETPSAADIAKAQAAKIDDTLARVRLEVVSKSAGISLLARIRDEAQAVARKQGTGWQEYAKTAERAQQAIDGLKKGNPALKEAKDLLSALSTQYEYAGKSGLPAYINGLRAFIREQEKVVASSKKDSKEQLDAMANVSRARQMLEDATKPKGKETVTVSQADMDLYRKQAEQVVLWQRELDKTPNSDRARVLQNQIAAYNAQGEAARNVLAIVSGAAQRREQLENEAEDRAKRGAEGRAAAEKALAEKRWELARDTAQGVIDGYQDELDAAGDNAEARLEVELRLGKDVLAARNTQATANAELEKQRLREERNRLMNAEGVTKEQRVKLWQEYGKLIAAEDTKLQATLGRNAAASTRAEEEARTAATEAKEEEARKDRARQQATYRVRQAIRQQNISLAEGELEKLRDLRQSELDAIDRSNRSAVEKARARLEVERRYATDERQLMTDLAALRKKDADARANSGPKQEQAGALRLSQQRYDADMRAVEGLDRVAQAEAKVTEEQSRQTQTLDGLVEKYRDLGAALQKKAEAGTLTDEDYTDYLEELGDLWTAAGQAGLKANPQLVAAHQAAKTLGQTARTTSEAVASLNLELEMQEESAQGVVKMAQDLMAAGRPVEAMQLLNGALDDLREQAAQGLPISIKAVGMLTDTMGKFNSELEEFDPQAFREWQETLASFGAVDRQQAAIDAEGVAASLQQGQTAQISTLFKGGPAEVARFLLGTDGQGFAETFWFDFTEASQQDFRQRLAGLDTEQLASLGTDMLQRLLDGMGDDEAWDELRGRVQAGMGRALEINTTGSIWTEVGQIAEQVEALDRTSATFADTLDNVVIPRLEALLALTSDPEQRAGIQATIEGLRQEGAEARTLAGELAAARAEAQQIENMDAGLAPLAQGLQTVLDGLDAGTLSSGAAREALAGLREQAQELGGEIAGNLIAVIDGLADRLDRLGDTEAGEAFDKLLGAAAGNFQSVLDRIENGSLSGDAARDALAALREELEALGGPEAARMVTAIDVITGRLDTLGEASRELAEAMGEQERPFAGTLKRLEKLRGEVGVDQVALEALIKSFGRLQEAAEKGQKLDFQIAQARRQIEQSGGLRGQGALRDALTQKLELARQKLAQITTREGPAYAAALGEVQAAEDALTEAKVAQINVFGDYAQRLIPGLVAAMQVLAGVGEEVAQGWGESLGSMVSDLVGFASALARGDYIGAAIQAFTSIFTGFARQAAEVRAEVKRTQEYANQFRFSDSGYGTRQVTHTQTGFLWWKKNVYKEEIDELGKQLALSFEGAVVGGVQGGLAEAVEKGDSSILEKAITTKLKDAALSGLTEAFLNSAGVAALMGPLVQGLIAAFKSGNRDLIQSALAEFKTGLAGLKPELDALVEAGQAVSEVLSTPTGGAGPSPEVLRDLAQRRLNTEETLLKLLQTQRLISTEEYERRKLDLALNRIRAQMKAELDAAGLTEEQIAAIQAEYEAQLALTQAEYDAQVRERALARERDVASRRLNNAELALRLEEQVALAGVQSDEERFRIQEAFERRRLELTLRRLEAEHAAALAAEGLTQDQIDVLTEEHALKRQEAQQALDLMVAEHQRQLAERAAEEQRRLAEQQEQTRQSWRQSLMGGVDALLRGDSPLEALYSGIRDRIAQAIKDGAAVKGLLARLDPFFDQLGDAITRGLDPTSIIEQIGRMVPGLAVEMQTTLGPLLAALNRAIPDLTGAVRDNTRAVKGIQYTQTTVVQAAPTLRLDDPLRAAFVRFGG